MRWALVCTGVSFGLWNYEEYVWDNESLQAIVHTRITKFAEGPLMPEDVAQLDH